jgi:hypothetical protein
MGDLPGHGQ